MEYDYILVGGGPTSLTLAWILGSNNQKVLILEKEDRLGGCHGVTRKDGYFTEHGPRIYSNSFLQFIELLKDMNMRFEDLFTPYNFEITKINKQTPLSFKFGEYIAFISAFTSLFLDKDYGKTISMKTFMENNNFTTDSTLYVDRICRLTDGASYEHYTIYQFLQLINQQILYKLYQPKKPTDLGLIGLWSEKLYDTNNVRIKTEEEVILLNSKDNKITSVKTNKGIYNGKNIILTIPPKPLYELIENSKLFNAFTMDKESLKQWTLENSYFDYICITYHYDYIVDLPKLWGFTQGPWDIVFIILSNYMDIEHTKSKTLISIAITKTNSKNEYGKTADDCLTEEELFKYVKEQLPFFPTPDKVILSPNMEHKDGKWINEDTAFVITTSNKYLDYKTNINNLYTVGTHNGHSSYKFTSIESTVQNAVYFIKHQLPHIKCNVKDTRITNINDLISIIIFVIILFIILRFIKK